jgi:predicted DCC family thiol-disulfide oxidoreductase YuxK
MAQGSSIYMHLKQGLEVDLRSLALTRILFGLVIVFDLFFRLDDLTFFYTDAGLLPREYFIRLLDNGWNWSVHLFSGESSFIGLLFVLHIILAICFVFGYKTRFVTLLLWILTSSLHNRNWLINNSGDDAIRLFLFICLFLPMGAFYSVDRAMSEKKIEQTHYQSIWVWLFAFQLFFVYFVSFTSKNAPEWKSDFTAVFYALHLSPFVSKIGVFFSDMIWLTKIFSFCTYYFFESLLPIILLLSFFTGKFSNRLRSFLSIAYIIFHFSLYLMMELGAFPFVMMALWTLFIHKDCWEKISFWVRKNNKKGLEIYYDADCGFCKKGVHLLAQFFLHKNYIIATAQSNEQMNKIMVEQNTWVVRNSKGEIRTRFDGIIELFKHSFILKYFAPLMHLPGIYQIGQAKYKWIAQHRPLMGKLTHLLSFNKEFRFFDSKIISITFFIVYFACSYEWVTYKHFKKMHFDFFGVSKITRFFNFYQEWDMFSPAPSMTSYWYSFVGEYEDGNKWDLLNKKKPDDNMPTDPVSASYPNKSWRKLIDNFASESHVPRLFAKYYCRYDRSLYPKKQKNFLKKIIFKQYLYNTIYPTGEREPLKTKEVHQILCTDL